MRKDNYAALVLVAFLFMGFLLMVLSKLAPHAHANPCTVNAAECYSIQGLFSHRDCPGQRPWFVESDGASFFMGCE